MKKTSFKFLFITMLSLGLTFSFAPDGHSAPGFGLRGTDLRVAGNEGPVSFIILGSQLTPGTSFTLVDPAGRNIAPTKQVFISEWRVLVTFDLRGSIEGFAHITATSGSDTSTLSNAIQISSGKQGNLDVQMHIQDEFQPGKPGLIQISYANTGNTDIDIPLLTLYVPQSTFLGTSPEGGNLGQSAVVLGVPNGPLYTSLRPQEKVTIPFYATLPNAGDAVASLVTMDPRSPSLNSIPLNYSGALSKVPDPQAPAAQNLVNDFRAEYGESLGSFYAGELSKLQQVVDQNGAKYQTVQHIDGQWQMQQAVPQPGPPRPSMFDQNAVQAPQVPVPVPGGTAGDGIKRTYAVIIGIGEYQVEDADLSGTPIDANNMYNFFRYEMRIPGNQITRLVSRTGGQVITKEQIQNAIAHSGADRDDNLVIYYSGHGTQVKNGSGAFIGAWAMGDADRQADGGYLNAEELSAMIVEKNAGQTYVISDSCHSGYLLSSVTAPRTAIFAASKAAEVSTEEPDKGGYFTSVLLHYWRKGVPLSEAFDKAMQMVPNLSIDPQHPVFSPDGVDINFPFGSLASWKSSSANRQLDSSLDWVADLIDMHDPDHPYHLVGGSKVPPPEMILQWAAEGQAQGLAPGSEALNQYVDQKVSEWMQQNGSSLASGQTKSKAFRVTPAVSNPSFVPGGFAVSQNRRLFYVSDNTGGRILMLNPAESRHRQIPLLQGLTNPGDLDIGDRGQSLVYTTANHVRRAFFGVTAYITNSAGNPLTGAAITLQGDFGEKSAVVDPSGYVTVMDLLKPSLSNRQIFFTVQHLGVSQLFPVKLLDTDQTFVTLVFTGNPNQIPVPAYPPGAEPDLGTGYVPGPGDGNPTAQPIPVPVPVQPGITTVAPDIPITAPAAGASSTSSGSTPGTSPPRIVILTPANFLVTGAPNLPLTGSVSESTITSVRVEINGATQTLPVSNNSFSANVVLRSGVNTIVARGTNSQGQEAVSSPVQVTVEAGSGNQTGAVSGRVLNQYGKPASGIRVAENGSGKQAVTDANGYYQFSGMTVGQATIQVKP